MYYAYLSKILDEKWLSGVTQYRSYRTDPELFRKIKTRILPGIKFFDTRQGPFARSAHPPPAQGRPDTSGTQISSSLKRNAMKITGIALNLYYDCKLYNIFHKFEFSKFGLHFGRSNGAADCKIDLVRWVTSVQLEIWHDTWRKIAAWILVVENLFVPQDASVTRIEFSSQRNMGYIFKAPISIREVFLVGILKHAFIKNANIIDRTSASMTESIM